MLVRLRKDVVLDARQAGHAAEGESNADTPREYAGLLPALIADWRRLAREALRTAHRAYTYQSRPAARAA